MPRPYVLFQNRVSRRLEEAAHAAALKGLAAARSLRPSLSGELPRFVLRPENERGLRGCWDGQEMTVSWHARPGEVSSVSLAVAHECGHRALQDATVAAVGAENMTRVRNALMRPLGAGLAMALDSWPGLDGLAEGYRSGPFRHGAYGASSPEEWLAEGFRLLVLGGRSGLVPHPAVADLLVEIPVAG